MTTPKEYLVPIQQNLFAVALVFEYHKELTYNNFFRNDYLWNEELTKTLIKKATTDKAKQLSANYLPMLLFLHKTYTESKEAEKLKEVDEAMDKVAVQCKKYDQVKKLKGSYSLRRCKRCRHLVQS
jgi:predicted peptidase